MVTERKIMFLLIRNQNKLMKISEKFRGNFRNSENSRKFSPENSRKIPGKFPENSRKIEVFLMLHTIIQSENHAFYYYKSNGNSEKFRETFGENFRNAKNSRKKFLRKIPGKFQGFVSVKCNDTERKSTFLCL